MCNNFPNIRITEGNNFSIILPLLSRTYVATRPIDEEIDPEQLQNVVVTFGGVQYPAQRTTRGVQIDLPATLAVGTYNILLTAEYLGSNIRAAYESAVTIVPWSEQSTAEQYITGSPIVLRAAYVLSGALTDAELEALKEEYREKNAQLAQAIADAEAAKREWEEKAADLDGVAQEETLTQGVADIRNDISHIDIDTTTLAKQGTNQNATLSEVQAKIGTPASGQGADLFAAMRDIALSATTLQELADAWSVMVTNRQDINGFVFTSAYNVQGAGDLYFNRTQVREIHDRMTILIPDSLRNLTGNTISVLRMDAVTSVGINQAFRGFSAREVYLPALQTINQNYMFADMSNLRTLYLPGVTSFPNSNNTFLSDSVLIDLTLGRIESSFSIYSWSPTTALNANSQTLLTPEDIAAGFTSNLEKLLYNIREHIAANLPVAPNTITFSATVKAAILADQPTADAFTNKNWTIA